MTYDIRPLSFGEILDRAFRVYLDNFMLLFGIAAVVLIPSGILQASAIAIGNNAATIIDAIFILVAAPVMQAALTIGVAEAYLDRPLSIADAYRSARPILVPFFGTYLLMAALFLVPGAAVGATLLVSRALFGFAILVFLVIAFYFIGCWALIGPVMIAEQHFGMAALRRSRQLVVGSWWRTVGLLFVAGLIAGVPAAALRFIWGFIPVLGLILTAATQAASSGFSVVALVIYYFDQRCRTEDFDLRRLAEQIRSQNAPAMTPAPGSSSLA